MTLATLQQLRSFNDGEHPINLEPGQIAFNMALGNVVSAENNYNIYMYVGNSTDNRLDENGTVLVAGGETGKGWIRYSLRSVKVTGDTIYGDVNVDGAKLRVQASGGQSAELIIPKETTTPSGGSEVGSIRWNNTTSTLQTWNGAKWDTASKVFVGSAPPANPSNGDMWMDPGPPGVLYIFVVPASGPAQWVASSSGGTGGGLQPGNGVTANALDQIELINIGSY